MPTDIGFCVIPHQTQCPVSGAFTHWFIRIVVAGEHQIQMADSRKDLIPPMKSGKSTCAEAVFDANPLNQKVRKQKACLVS
ncbi:hypothetical protein CIT292_07589 [Citrobacter youngae ATCC 29220]|uniref:Uncharacterized protein n=1 Tax=Citrobacter youngae ATCC 29220 TaxID=500640 RepID=D4BAU3_9ENTR|nr:hypothetical protein CIT292_07589 [Citrobacter youngae ATCC 29220]